MRTHSTKCILLSSLFSVWLLTFATACAAQNSYSQKLIQSFSFSEDFAKRFSLPVGESKKNWPGTIAVALKHDKNSQAAACGMTIYLGNDIEFSYPKQDNYTNLLGEQIEQLFFFQPQLSEDDERHLSAGNVAGANRIVLKALDKKNRMTAMESITISTVDKNALPGIHIINSHRFFCHILNTGQGLEMSFQKPLRDGDVIRTETIKRYDL